MQLRFSLAAIAGFIVVASGIAFVPDRAGASGDAVERGRYLVRQVGQCADCHGSALHGAKLDAFRPDLPIAHEAPRIASLPQFTTHQAIVFLSTGRLPNGKMARPPMPQYRFDIADATAIVAYLKSLP